MRSPSRTIYTSGAVFILFFWGASAVAAPSGLQPGNVLVASGTDLLEIDYQNTALVQSIRTPPDAGTLLDVVANGDGRVVVLSDDPTPTVHVMDFRVPATERSWTRFRADQWQLANAPAQGGLAVIGHIAFVANVSQQDGTAGVLALNLETGEASWAVQGAEYSQLVLGDHFHLYALRREEPAVDVIDIQNLPDSAVGRVYRHTRIDEVESPRAIAVDFAGTLFVAGADGTTSRYAGNGRFLGESPLPWREASSLAGLALDSASRQGLVTEEDKVALSYQGEVTELPVPPGGQPVIGFVPETSPTTGAPSTFLALHKELDGLPAGPEAAQLLFPHRDEMELALNGRTLEVRYTGAHNWTLAFSVPEPFAMDWLGTHTFGSDGAQGVGLVVGGQECDAEGRFRIRNLDLDEAGQPVSAAIQFTHRCSGSDASLSGIVAYNADRQLPSFDVPILPLLLRTGPDPVLEGDPVTLSTPREMLIDNEIVDYRVTQLSGTPVSYDVRLHASIGGNVDKPYLSAGFLAPLVDKEGDELAFRFELEAAGGTRYAAVQRVKILSRKAPRTRLYWMGPGLNNGLALLELRASDMLYVKKIKDGVQIGVQGHSSDGELAFAAPHGTGLSPGTYTNAKAWPWRDPSAPAMWFADYLRSCETEPLGEFTVREAKYSEDEVEELVMDFEFQCDGGVIEGEFFYNDTRFTLVDADAGADQTVESGAQVVLDASASSAPEGALTGLYWQQVSGPEVPLPVESSAQATFTAPEADRDPVTLVFQVKARGDSSHDNVDRVSVQVLPATEDPDEEVTDPEPGGSLAERIRRFWAAFFNR